MVITMVRLQCHSAQSLASAMLCGCAAAIAAPVILMRMIEPHCLTTAMLADDCFRPPSPRSKSGLQGFTDEPTRFPLSGPRCGMSSRSLGRPRALVLVLLAYPHFHTFPQQRISDEA